MRHGESLKRNQITSKEKKMKFFVNFSNLDSDGYHTGIGGMVSDTYGETHNEDCALTFETRKEAENWCKNAEKYGWNTHAVEFKVWSYDE